MKITIEITGANRGSLIPLSQHDVACCVELPAALLMSNAASNASATGVAIDGR